MISTDDVQTLLGRDGSVLDSDGDKIGKIGQVFVDDQTGQPEWVTVTTGMFGRSESFVPLAEGSVSGDDIRVPYSKDQVKDAPRVDDSEGHLSQDEEAQLYTFYGMSYTQNSSDSGLPTGQPDTRSTDPSAPHEAADTRPDYAGDADVEGQDTSGPTTDHAMTRSEEQLKVGTETVAAGKAKLRKYVVTENVTQTVPVSHEEVRLEREPITEGNRGAAMAGTDLSEEEHEVILTEERVVTSKETVPVERVKLATETVTTDEQVEEQVAKEQIEYDDSDLPESTPRHSAG